MAVGAVGSGAAFYGTTLKKRGKSTGIAERGWELQSKQNTSATPGSTRAGGRTLLDVYNEMKCNNIRGVGGSEGADGAVRKVAHAEAGEFIGVTMVPEEGDSAVYGMTAFLVESSTPENPIVQIRSNLGGERSYYNVEINKVNPKCATQLEMFALLSYTDKMGVTDGGTFGSFQKLSVYAMNAYENGHCEELTGVDNFLNKTFDWPEIIESVMQDYLDAQLRNQYEDCEMLLNYFEEDDSENADAHKYIQDKMIEILEKIEKGETETSYQIGSGSFTEEEWDNFLENFDSIQEVLKELMKERIEKKEEEELEKELEELKLEEEKLEEEIMEKDLLQQLKEEKV